MKRYAKWLLGPLAACVMTSGCISIADAIILALVLPAEYCFDMDTTSDSDWDGEDMVCITELISDIDSDYLDSVQSTYVTDILVYVQGPYPSGGDVAGTAEYSLDGGVTWVPFVSFAGLYSQFAAPGVSVLNPDPNLGTFIEPATTNLINLLSSETGLPTIDKIYVRASGTTTPVDQQGVQICFRLELGATAEL